ncbi:MAG: hypothetical protein AVDCRST_MAG45-2359 [uncultured Solirubrobacterales bacterium]|uniref:Uncharacterized protein n=1 Tax=uncultured Solirubrobacterales bacterium TaxID=768556 RepID=A0A6J4TAK5_9ACTN|nr:MAG: hypothetical protein AVDCRST_MAG45-2359 [uncultured Solirubrobacterales bacterium]
MVIGRPGGDAGERRHSRAVPDSRRTVDGARTSRDSFAALRNLGSSRRSGRLPLFTGGAG